MTADTRFERDLPSILEDLYLGPAPDYRHEALAVATRRRQRPAWTFPGRWLPMADIASRPVIAPRIPWRALGTALVLIALLVAALVIVAGSRQTKVPPPFGLASNGLIAYANGGDIYSIDPANGSSVRITSGPEIDRDPVYSHDGTRVAFRRVTNTASGSPAEALLVVDPDGRVRTITTEPVPAGLGRFEWAPDSRSILAEAPSDGLVWLFDATTAAAPRVVTTDANIYPRAFRPPDGEQILISREDAFGSRIVLLDLDTGDERDLAKGGSDEDHGAARWSPDGSKVVFNDSPLDDNGTQRLFTVNADGTGTRQVTDAWGVWFDIDATWSPDGKRIAFLRYQLNGESWEVRPIGVLDVATGVVTEVGPYARDVRAAKPSEYDYLASAGEGMFVEWSPDGASIIAFPSEAAGHPVLVDPDHGTWRVLDQLIDPGVPIQNWQRTAP